MPQVSGMGTDGIWFFGACSVLLDSAFQAFGLYRLYRLRNGSPKQRASASAICILAAFELESILQEQAQQTGISQTAPWAELVSQIQDSRLRDFANEVDCVRNALAHNHLYEETVRYDTAGFSIGSNATRVRGGFNQIFQGSVRRNKTIHLKMNVVPRKIGLQDGLLCLKMAQLTHAYFENGRGLHIITYNNHTNPISNYLNKYIDTKIRELPLVLQRRSLRRKIAILAPFEQQYLNSLYF